MSDTMGLEDTDLNQDTMIQRPYQKVADQLLSDIADGKYAVGDRLPSERRLAEQFGLGRPIIREAIIALEIVNAVVVKPNSGIYVLSRQEKLPAAMLDLDAGPFELLEARLLIEGEVAYMAANTLSNADLEALEDVMDQMRAANENADIELAEFLDGKFHEIIAEGMNNSVLHAIVTDMRKAQERSPLATRLLARIHGQGVGRRIEEHTDILTALQARDPHGARAAMRRHVGCVIAELAAANEFEPAPNRDSQTRDTSATRRSIIRTANRG